jgi:hypothetical protein
MDPVTMAAIQGGVGLLGKIGGLIGSASANKKHERAFGGLLENKKNEVAGIFDQQLNQDFLDTDVAKSALNRINETMQGSLQRNESAMAGATDEAKIAGRTAVNKTYNESLSNLTGLGTQYRDSMRQQKMQAMMGLFGMEAQNMKDTHEQKQETWKNLMANSNDTGKNAGDLAAILG